MVLHNLARTRLRISGLHGAESGWVVGSLRAEPTGDRRRWLAAVSACEKLGGSGQWGISYRK